MLNQLTWTRRNIIGLPLWLLATSVSGQEQTSVVPSDALTSAASEVNGIGLRVFIESLKRRQEGNVVVSPLSLAVALQMTATGAAGRGADSCASEPIFPSLVRRWTPRRIASC